MKKKVYGKLNCNVYPIRRKNSATACSVRLRGMLRQLSGPRVRRLPMLWSAVAESLSALNTTTANTRYYSYTCDSDYICALFCHVKELGSVQMFQS
jgi:hypothetical protein